MVGKRKAFPEKGQYLAQETPEKRGSIGNRGGFIPKPRLAQFTPTGYTEGIQ